ncbi:hypothetical protein THRCLA_21179 [Thraustotheca clavata]|uniref:Uncharacterized protein n=1 Tax=Thraustotheca clavata TaxID=74557 RepID=A0A1V9ZZI5_9STRA|nr:hypothetical protein THRCLA_21179 [Thraustotheca clavata]
MKQNQYFVYLRTSYNSYNVCYTKFLVAINSKYAFNTAYCTTQILEPLENGSNFPFQLLEHEKV